MFQQLNSPVKRTEFNGKEKVPLMLVVFETGEF